MAGNLHKLGYVMARSNYGGKFWQTLLKSCEKAGGSANISVAGWKKLLDIAREDGLVGRITDENGKPTNQLASDFTYALVMQYRRVMQAEAEGLTAEQFSRAIESDVIAAQLGVKRASSDFNGHHANVQREQQEQRDRYSRVAQRTRRRLDDEEEI